MVGLTASFQPLALIGAGGIGKTSIALAVLHNDYIKARFGENRRFIRCDQFPASRTHFLARLSKVIGAEIENPEDLTPLRPLLSSRETILFLDNAEYILDPQGNDAREIYAMVEELSRFSNICLGITSRISTIPPHFERPIIPPLSVESACEIFYGIYNSGGRSDLVNDLVGRLDFHPLSITLLATTASHNMWDYGRLAQEWDIHRAQVLRTDYNESLAATIELSLASPTFRKLGPSAREILGVVAFFPQGVDENNLDWLFPTIPDRRNIFDKFCVLSLTSRNCRFFTMLAPIRDYLFPRDPKSSPLLCATRGHYLDRLSVDVDPRDPNFKETRWIMSEDVNVEHLLDVFTSLDPNVDDVWDACIGFMGHLYWHKARQTVLRSKIESLPDNHHLKPRCLFELARLLQRAGNPVEQKQLLTHALKLSKARGYNRFSAWLLRSLSQANRMLQLFEAGIQQAEEASKIFEELGDTVAQAQCLIYLAHLLSDNRQLDAAEEAVSRGIGLLPEKGLEFSVCDSHRVLGRIYRSKGNTGSAIHHLEVALGIASGSNWQGQIFWIHYTLAQLFSEVGKFDEAHAHTDQAESHAPNLYNLGRSAELRAQVLYRQRRPEEAMSEGLRALEIFEELGATNDLDVFRPLLGKIWTAKRAQCTIHHTASIS